MKITKSDGIKHITFSELDIGDVFGFEGGDFPSPDDILMKTADNEAVNLTKAGFVELRGEDVLRYVIPYEATLNVVPKKIWTERR